MKNIYPTRLVLKLSGATYNQLKYWVKQGLVRPDKKGKTFFYSFRDIIKLRLIVSLKMDGLSFQKIKKGINNLTKTLPNSDDLLSRLIIHTDGTNMIVSEKGNYFSATTMQRYLQFDTEQIKTEIIELQKADKTFPKSSELNEFKMSL